MSKTIVELKVYKGKALYDENGKIATPNEKLTLEYENEAFARKKGWENHIGNLPRMGYSKVDFVALYVNGVKAESHETLEAIKADVAGIFTPQAKTLTPEQKRIADLEAKLEALLADKKPVSAKAEAIEVKDPEVIAPGAKIEIPTKADAAEELKAAREQYEKVVGKKGGPAWDVATINAKIEEHKSKNA